MSNTNSKMKIASGMSTDDIEAFINVHGNEHMKNEFAGVYPSDKLVDTAEILQNLRTVNHNLAYVIANTDPKGKPGTHWWTMFNIAPSNSIYFFDSFGLAGFKRFILQDDAVILENVFSNEGTRKTDGITFETIAFQVNSYKTLTQNSIDQLSRTAVGFLNFLTSFAKYNKYKKVLNVHIVKDSLQEFNTSYCGAFCLYLLFNLFNPEESSSVINDRRVTPKVVNTLISELFYNGEENKRNTSIIKAFIREYDIQGEFT